MNQFVGQDFMGWYGLSPGEEEEAPLTDEELQLELERFFQQMGGPPPSLRRADSNPLMPQDVNVGMGFLQATPNRQKVDRSKGEANALHQLSQQTGPRPPAPGNYGRAMAEREWGSGSPQQLPFDSIPSVEETRFNPPPQMPPAGEQPPFDAAIPPDDLYNRLNQAPGTTEPQPSLRRTEGGPRWQPTNPNVRGNQADGPVRSAWVGEDGSVTEVPPRHLSDAERGPAPTFPGQPQYQDTMYAGMTPEQRQLMQLQPDDKFGPLLRTAEELGIPVEMQYSENGNPRPVIDTRYIGALMTASPEQQNLFRGAVFSDELVDGVPTFTDASLRRRINTGRITDPAVEERRIERDRQEEFERLPEVRAAREQARIERENEEAALTTEYDLRDRNSRLELERAVDATAGASGDSRPEGWQALRDPDPDSQTFGQLQLAAFDDNPELANEMAKDITPNIRRMAQNAGLLGEGPGQIREEDIDAYTSRLLMSSAREQQGVNPALPSHLPVEAIQDLVFLSLSAANRTKGWFRDDPGKYAANSLGDAINTITDLITDSGGTRDSAGQNFNWKDMSGEESRALANVTGVLDNLAQRSPGSPQYRRYVNGRVSQLEADIQRVKNQLLTPPEFFPPAGPGTFHVRNTLPGGVPTLSPQERAPLERELATLQSELAKFTNETAADIRGG